VILATSRSSDFIYSIDANTQKWQWQRTGFPLFLVRPVGGRLFAASLNSGVLTDAGNVQSRGGQDTASNAAQK
jgi:hypothetical protein